MLKEKLMEDLKQSMKDKNVVRKNVVQMVRASILQVEKDNGIEVEDNKILDIIAKEVKKRKDSLADLINQAKEEIAILEEYLPKQLTKEELTEKVKEIIEKTGATSMKDMGKVMKACKEEIGASADGKAINEVVKEILA